MNVPPGRLVASSKWQGTELSRLLKAEVEVHFCNDSGEYDFLASSELAMVFFNEGEILSDDLSIHRRLLKFCQVNGSLRKVVIAQRSLLTYNTYFGLQKLCAIDLGLSLIPVSTLEETVKLLKQIVTCESKRNNNPFRLKPQIKSPDESVLETLQVVPGFGGKKSSLLIEKFLTLKNVMNASREELAEVVGQSAANSAYNFFHKTE